MAFAVLWSLCMSFTLLPALLVLCAPIQCIQSAADATDGRGQHESSERVSILDASVPQQHYMDASL